MQTPDKSAPGSTAAPTSTQDQSGRIQPSQEKPAVTPPIEPPKPKV